MHDWKLAVAGVLGVLVAVCSAVADDDSLGKLVALRAALQAEAVWQVPFTQEYVPAGFSEGDRVTGQLWLQWPDRMLFVSGEPPVQWLGLHGRQVRLLDLDAETCEDHRLSDQEWERIPLVAVLDPQRAVELFSITAGADGEIVLLPSGRSDLERLQLAVAENGLPLELVVHDGQGSVNRFLFEGWEAAESSVEWIPQPPDGVACFGE